MGESNVEIELVAYSIGVKMFFNSSAYAEIIYNLLEKDVTFAACSNTLNSFNASPEELIKEIKVVYSGRGDSKKAKRRLDLFTALN